MSTATKKSVAFITSNALKVGSILSETSFYVIEDFRNDKIIVRDDLGNKITMGEPYVKQICTSADLYDSEEKKTMSELADIFINSPRIAMTVAFFKKDAEKTKTAYNKEVSDAILRVQNAKVSEVEGLLKSLIENPISRVIPGELRVMKGRHHGHIDELGRIHFIDMELPKDTKAAKDGSMYDTRKREVDPRTIQWLIVNKVKYVLK